MSRLEAIESQFKDLGLDELKALRESFAEFGAEIWNRQCEADAESGRLDKALRDHEAGNSTEL